MTDYSELRRLAVEGSRMWPDGVRAFHKAASPSVVLAMLDKIEALEALDPPGVGCKNDHQELSLVWEALGIREYNGKSASENVKAMLDELEALRATVELLRVKLKGLGETI